MTTPFARHAALIAVALLACAHQAQAESYSFKVLGSLGGSSSGANAINDLGQVVGFSWTSNGNAASHAVLWSGANTVDLGTLGGASSIAYDINDAGQIVGVADRGSLSHATLWQGTTVTDLGTLGGWDSAAYGINKAGQIVGSAYLGFDSHAALWNGGTVTDLGTLGGDYSTAQAINNAGQIVGTSYNAHNAEQRATQWIGNVATELSSPDGSWTGGHAINDAGVIVGRMNDPVLWIGGVMTPLDTLGGTPLNVYATNTLAWSINNAGQVVGFSQTLDHAQHATLWDGTGIVDLNQFLSSDDVNAGWELVEARDINNSGIIVGTASNKLTGVSSAFVLTPSTVPEPSTWLLTLSGLIGSLAITRHRSSRR
jgi:probable HAF family extracellular repeat protein